MPPPTHPNPPPQTNAAPQKKHAPACLPTAVTANKRLFAKSNMPRLAAPQLPPQTPAAPQKQQAPANSPKPATASTRHSAKEACPRLLAQTRHRKQTPLRKRSMPLLACPQLQPPTPAALQTKHASANSPTPATANKRCFANGTRLRLLAHSCNRKHAPGIFYRHAPQTQADTLNRQPVTLSLTQGLYTPPFPHLPQIPGQARNDVPKPHPQDKKNPGSQNHREKSQTKRLFVCSRRKFLLTASSINCSLCSLKLLSIALLAELADCALSSVNSFLCSTVYKSL